MNDELKALVNQCGMRKDFIADKIGVQRNHFYQCCSGNRTLSKKRTTMLQTLLNSLQETTASV